MTRASSFALAGVVPFSSAADRPGFLLPVFVDLQQGFHIQVPDVRSRVVQQFIPVADVRKKDVQTDVPNIATNAGSPLIFAFRNETKVVVGTLQQLLRPLNEYAESHPEDTATILQIMELTGAKPSARREVKARMVSHISATVGYDASRNFAEVSLFLESLWNYLVERASDEKLDALSSARRSILLDADLEKPEIFSKNIAKWIRSELEIDLDGIREEFGFPDLAEHVLPKEVDEPWKSEIEAILSEPRQEGRVARIIQRVMENPDVGLRLVRTYRDNATFANNVLELLNSNADHLRWSPNEGFANWLVDRLYSMAYPRQRGILLYELADHVGKYSAFSEAILRKAHSTNAEAVAYAREAILERIRNPASPKPPLPPRPGYYYGSGSYRGFPFLVPTRS